MEQNKENLVSAGASSDALVSSYETVFICDLSLGEDGVKALVEKFIKMIEEAGELTGRNEWGKRRLAYPINDLNEGYYVLVTFNAPHDFPTELQRVFNITDGIMRSMVIAIDAKQVAATVQKAAPAEVVITGDDDDAPPARGYNRHSNDAHRETAPAPAAAAETAPEATADESSDGTDEADTGETDETQA